jgi:hypothetical protein
LAERAQRWGARYRELTIPDGPWWSYQVIWVVHSDWRRVNTIRQVLRQHAQCPLLIATVKDLTIDGVMHPFTRRKPESYVARCRSLSRYMGKRP